MLWCPQTESLASAQTEVEGRRIQEDEEEKRLEALRTEPIEEKDLTDLMNELQSWKREHEA